MAFRGHDESKTSFNQGNFLELLKFFAAHDEIIKNASLQNALSNFQLTAPEIQKDIVNAVAMETTNVIIKELEDAPFFVLVDGSRDISIKEQMAVVLRYIDDKSGVLEHFLGIIHVPDTTALSLKTTLEALLSKYGLRIMSLRGQGYDSASNMQGELNRLKSLILRENKSAYYVHCFAHRLQLALVDAAKKYSQTALLFTIVTNAVNIVGASCKSHDIIRDKRLTDIRERLEMGELSTGKGLNQETSLKRAADTRWESHYATIIRLITMFSYVIDLLDIVVKHGLNAEQKGEAYALLYSMQSFDFILNLHIMRNMLGTTNELWQTLQREDQDIVNAMDLVKVSKQRLQIMIDDEWELLLTEVNLFYAKHHIPIPQMCDNFVARGRSRRRAKVITNEHHYCIDLFYTCIDLQRQELDNRFDEVNTELLLCVACLNPNASFPAFNKEKLLRLAQFYESDFSERDVMVLKDQLDTCILDMGSNENFLELKGIQDLSKKMVETKKKMICIP